MDAVPHAAMAARAARHVQVHAKETAPDVKRYASRTAAAHVRAIVQISVLVHVRIFQVICNEHGGGGVMSTEMTRREFLKKSLLLSAAALLFGKNHLMNTEAAITDNLGGAGKGISIGNTQPDTSSPYLVWINTSGNQNVMKYRKSRDTSSWTNVSSVWS